jgi:Zn-dependent protease with chaperone function
MRAGMFRFGPAGRVRLVAMLLAFSAAAAPVAAQEGAEPGAADSAAARIVELVRTGTPDAISEAQRLAWEATAEYPGNPGVLWSAVLAGMSAGDENLLASSIPELMGQLPRDPFPHYAAAFLAGLQGRWDKAERALNRSEDLGLPHDIAEKFRQGTGLRPRAHRGPAGGVGARHMRALATAGFTGLGWIAGLLVLFAVGALLSALTLRTIDRREVGSPAVSPGGMRLMRRTYAGVVGLTSAYYYLSLPFVLAVILGGGGAILYYVLTAEHVPVRLAAVVLLFMAVSTYSILTSLFLREREGDPGPTLEGNEAPDLFAALGEVAERIGTRPVDRVFITPGTEVAVFERGSAMRRGEKRRERCLILGAGVLEGMSAGQLKAVLAHEYGHFVNRDTAGGGLALHVRRSILHTARSMARGGASSLFNPAWIFVNAFFRIFLRVTQGASRLQEVLADRWAALSYGGRAFAEGLRHVVRRAIEFDLLSEIEITDAIDQNRGLRNLYSLRLPEDWDEPELHEGEGTPRELVDRELARSLEAPGSPYDSHPPAGRRIAWVGKLGAGGAVGDDPSPAWSLFRNPEEIQLRMTALVAGNVQEALARRTQEVAAQGA